MYVDNQMQKYIHLSKYAKWVEELGQREPSWGVSVRRLKEFWMDQVGHKVSLRDLEEFNAAFKEIERLGVMPSMRTLMTAGPALRRDHAAGFNCAAIAVNHPRCFDEIFHLLMCGTGVGFSVERQYTNELPAVAEEHEKSSTVIVVEDSKDGWAKGLRELLSLLYSGAVPSWDLSRVRPAGARLKTFGGRASGPEPLDRLFHYAVRVFTRAKGRKLNSLECHDLVCKIADTVIVGSVRRSACISLSNLSDHRMAKAKNGFWFDQNPERALANNSVAYTELPDMSSWLREISNLHESKAGERGIVNKNALKAKAEECDREYAGDYLLNPCGEAILRDSGGLCNLSEVVIEPTDTLETLVQKVQHAALLGTLQSTLTDFKYLRKIWSDNQSEERLLGVSLTGIMDHPVMSDIDFIQKDLGDWFFEGEIYAGTHKWTLPQILEELRCAAIDTNLKWSKVLGIPHSKQLTLIKPSGTVSQLVGSSSGIHPRYAPFYFRRVTQDTKDPLTQVMIDQGIPHVSQGEKTIFSFPIKSPEGAICARDMGAMQQLRLWKVYREFWCDGNPSQTIYYTDDDFLEVMHWVRKNWDIIGGLSFFPIDDFVYDRATQPYLEVTEDEYKDALEQWPKHIDWSLKDYETTDNTTSSQEFACAGDQCEIK